MPLNPNSSFLQKPPFLPYITHGSCEQHSLPIPGQLSQLWPNEPPQCLIHNLHSLTQVTQAPHSATATQIVMCNYKQNLINLHSRVAFTQPGQVILFLHLLISISSSNGCPHRVPFPETPRSYSVLEGAWRARTAIPPSPPVSSRDTGSIRCRRLLLTTHA